MIKQRTILETKRGERIYQCSMEPDSTLGEIYDVLSEMRALILHRIIEEDNKEKVRQAGGDPCVEEVECLAK